MTQDHIEQAIDKALNCTSGIDSEILKIRGFSTVHIRELFKALCDTEEPINYLEIGLYCGATFCSSFNKNCTSIGIENHFQDFGAGFETVKKELVDNVENFKPLSKEVKVIYADCFDMDKSVLPKIDVYFMDGFHSFDTQAKALPYFFDNMKDKFIFIVDDFSWSYVKEGTLKGFEDLKDKIEIERQWILGEGGTDNPIWHNSVAIFLINKK